jgi:uncharacterized protein YndB with AHSA1/START domain
MNETIITAEPGQPQLLIDREFDAPLELVYRAYTDPELLVQWLGPRRLAMTMEQYEPRHGGSYRYIHRDTDGTEYMFRGVFHGTPSPDGIVQTFEFEGAPGHVALETARFEDLGGRTRVRASSVYQSVDDRDAAIASGMESGIHESHERLTELLPTLTPVR